MTTRVDHDQPQGELSSGSGNVRRSRLKAYPFSAARHVGMIPRRTAATTGRGVQLFADVLRYVVTDAITMRLAVGEVFVQAWTLLKVTTMPALLMAIPIGAITTIVTSGLVNQLGRPRCLAPRPVWVSFGRGAADCGAADGVPQRLRPSPPTSGPARSVKNSTQCE